MDDIGKRIYTIDSPIENDKNQPPLNEERFREKYFYNPPSQPSFASHLKPTRCTKDSLLNLFPIFRWLPKYRKENIISDVIAGLTVAVMHIPQGMAYALLGGVPPVVGIYMAFFPVLVYITMGTSRHVSMGTFAVVCMMVGKSVDVYSRPPEGQSDDIFYEPPTPMQIASAVCLIVGIWQIILSVLRLGSLSVLLSQTLISGFTTGAAVHVSTSQTRNLLGIKAKRHSGPLKVIRSYINLFENIGSYNAFATTLSVCFIIFLVIYNEVIKPRLQKRFKRTLPIPVELIVVIIGTVLSDALNLKETYGVAVVDNIPKGLPSPSIPPLHLLPELIVDGLIIAIVSLSINISMASIFAQKKGYEIDGNQEILATGAGNIFSAFFSCMPYAASLSRSLIQESVGGQTQITSVVSCITLAFVLLFIGPFFQPLPYCVLSTIIVVALKGMFNQIWDLPNITRNSKLDGFVWIITFLSVVVLDIDYGLGIGLMASAATLLLRTQSTDVVTLGQIPNTGLYVDVNRFDKSQKVANVLILQILGGLHFANASSVRKTITKIFSKFCRNVADGLSNKKQSKCLSLIIDFSCVPFVDPSAIKSLKMIYEHVQGLQSNLLLCGCIPSVYEALEKSQHLENYPKCLIFHTVNDAVGYAKKLQNGVEEYITKL